MEQFNFLQKKGRGETTNGEVKIFLSAVASSADLESRIRRDTDERIFPMDSDGSERHVELGLYSHVSSNFLEIYK
jgi:hypothetical protein